MDEAGGPWRARGSGAPPDPFEAVIELDADATAELPEAMSWQLDVAAGPIARRFALLYVSIAAAASAVAVGVAAWLLHFGDVTVAAGDRRSWLLAALFFAFAVAAFAIRAAMMWSAEKRGLGVFAERFGALLNGARATLGPDGLIYVGDRAEGRMAWTAFDQVRLGRATIWLVAGGGATPLPTAKLSVPADEAMRRIRVWSGAAAAPGEEGGR